MGVKEDRDDGFSVGDHDDAVITHGESFMDESVSQRENDDREDLDH